MLKVPYSPSHTHQHAFTIKSVNVSLISVSSIFFSSASRTCQHHFWCCQQKETLLPCSSCATSWIMCFEDLKRNKRQIEGEGEKNYIHSPPNAIITHLLAAPLLRTGHSHRQAYVFHHSGLCESSEWFITEGIWRGERCWWGNSEHPSYCTKLRITFFLNAPHYHFSHVSVKLFLNTAASEPVSPPCICPVWEQEKLSLHFVSESELTVPQAHKQTSAMA